MAQDKIGSLQEESFKRKERVEALKRKADDGKENKNEISNKLPTWVLELFRRTFKSNLNRQVSCFEIYVYLLISDRPKFRSYKPQDENLKDKVLDDAKPGNVEAEVQEQLSAANTKVVIEELVSTYIFTWNWNIYST